MATDRRGLVAGLSAAAALAACQKKPEQGAAARAAAGALHCFVAEAGGVGTSGFMVGMLTCRDPAAQLAALKELRRRTGFRTAFSAGSTNRYKLLYAQPAFRRLAEDAGLGAVGVAFAFPGWEGRSRAQRRAAHEAAYRALAAAVPAADRAGAVAHLTGRSSDQASDARLAAALRQSIGGAALDGARYADLMQLAAALFGTVRYAASGGRSRVKLKTVDALKTALGVGQLDAASLGRTGKVAISSMQG